MIAPLLRGLSEETVVLLRPSQTARLPFAVKGVVRLVDGRGRTLGVVLDKESLEELREEVEAAQPTFLASLEASRRSGRISGKEVRKKIGLA